MAVRIWARSRAFFRLRDFGHCARPSNAGTRPTSSAERMVLGCGHAGMLEWAAHGSGASTQPMCVRLWVRLEPLLAWRRRLRVWASQRRPSWWFRHAGPVWLTVGAESVTHDVLVSRGPTRRRARPLSALLEQSPSGSRGWRLGRRGAATRPRRALETALGEAGCARTEWRQRRGARAYPPLARPRAADTRPPQRLAARPRLCVSGASCAKAADARRPCRRQQTPATETARRPTRPDPRADDDKQQHSVRSPARRTSDD